MSDLKKISIDLDFILQQGLKSAKQEGAVEDQTLGVKTELKENGRGAIEIICTDIFSGCRIILSILMGSNGRMSIETSIDESEKFSIASGQERSIRPKFISFFSKLEEVLDS